MSTENKEPIRKKRYLKSMYGCISTYDTLQSKWPIITDFIEEFVDQLVRPLNKDLVYFFRGERIRRKEYQFSSDWEKTKDLILAGRVKSIFLAHVDKKIIEAVMQGLDNSGNLTGELLNLNIISNTLDDYDGRKTASLIEFSINESLYNGEIPLYVYSKYVTMLEQLTDTIDSAGGLITLDVMSAFSSASSHEVHMGLIYPIASRDFNKYFRGYCWGNFLSKNHVQLLGGIARIQKEAPVFLVKELNDGGAYLQLTKDVNHVSDEDLRKLKKYFEPILPKAPFMLNPREAHFRRMIIDDDDESRFL